MSSLIRVAPAPYSALLEVGGNRIFLRRALIWQHVQSETIALYTHDQRLVCVAMFKQWRQRRFELAVLVTPLARKHMTGILREAHLTLSQIQQSSILIYAHINPLNRQSMRMARMVGFRPGKFRDKTVWIFKGDKEHGWFTRRKVTEGSATKSGRTGAPIA